MPSYSFYVEANYAGWRLDIWLHHSLIEAGYEYSRSLVQRWIKEACVVNEKGLVLSKRKEIIEGERYTIQVELNDKEKKWEAVPMDFPILYEDEYLILIHKAPNLPVYPGPGKEQKEKLSLAHGLLDLWQKKKLWEVSWEEKEKYRFGLVHRLDKDTEGLLLLAKSPRVLERLMELFAKREIYKEYLAWTWSHLKPVQGEINLSLRRHPKERLKMQVHKEGREAFTLYETKKVINNKKGRKFSKLKLVPRTGRTHQLRAHLAYQQCPIVGDALYSRNRLRKKNFGLLLLAQALSFTHPFFKKEMSFRLDPPQRFLDFEEFCEEI